MGFHFQNSGFTSFSELMKSVVKDMVSGGFEVIHSNVDPTQSTILLDTIEIYENESIVTEGIDYEDITEANPDGTVPVVMNVAPVASDRLTANFLYEAPPYLEEGIKSPDLAKTLNTEFMSVGALPDQRYYNFDTASIDVVLVEPNVGSAYPIGSDDLTATQNSGYLNVDFIDPSDIPSNPNYTLTTDVRIDTTARNWLQYSSIGNAAILYDDVNHHVTYEFPFAQRSGLQTISGGDYTNFTNIDGSEVFQTIYHEIPIFRDWYNFSHIPVVSITTSSDLSTLTVVLDFSTYTTQYDIIKQYGGTAYPRVHHKLYYVEEGLELVGDKGYTETFRSREFGGTVEDHISGRYDFTTDPTVYVDSVLQTLGTDYQYSIDSENSRLEVTFNITSVPQTGSTVTMDYTYIPLQEGVDVPLIGAKNGTNTDFEISVVFNGDFYILEAGIEVDPLQNTQPWRIALDVGYEENLPLYRVNYDHNVPGNPALSLVGDAIDNYELNPYVVDEVGHYNVNLTTVKNYGKIYLGTPVQLQDDGTIAFMPLSDRHIGPYGRVYDEYTTGLLWTGIVNYSSTTIEYDQATDDNFVLAHSDAIANSLDINVTRPMSYDLAISDRGFSLMLKSDGRDDGKGNYFIVAQRLADARDGSVLTDGYSPVVCLYHQEYIDSGTVGDISADSVLEHIDEKIKLDDTGYGIEGFDYILNRRYDINMMIVRESDVHTPAKPVPVYENSPYINGVWNKEKQLSISDKKKYLIIIPDGINTHRHLYSNKRMDMIAFCSANIIMEGGIAKVTVHDEPEKREYKAQRASIGYVEGWRMLQLINNGGI